MDSGDKKKQVKQFFSQHAAAYAASTSHKSGLDLERLLQLLAPRPEHRALDVATATGHTALTLAPLVAEVVGADLTPAMRPQFEQAAQERGVHNARFQVADAEALPFPDGSFDLVTSRRAAHHFPNIRRAMAEMARVLRPGGRLGISDMTSPLEPGGAEFNNALEIARDGSHVWAYTTEEWKALAEGAGLRVLHQEVEEEVMPWARWLNPVPADGPEAAEAEAVLARTPPEVARLVVSETSAGRMFHKRRCILIAEKPA